MTNHSDTAALRAENEHLRQRVTELEQVAQICRAQVHRYEQVLNTLPAMVSTKDTQSRLTYGNAAFRELYGLSQDALQGMMDAAFHDPAHTAQSVEDDASVLHTGQARGPLSLGDLAHKLGVDRGTLDGMLTFWVRKGRIVVSDIDGQTCATGGGCGHCDSSTGCPFAGTAPRTFALVTDDAPPATNTSGSCGCGCGKG